MFTGGPIKEKKVLNDDPHLLFIQNGNYFFEFCRKLHNLTHRPPNLFQKCHQLKKQPSCLVHVRISKTETDFKHFILKLDMCSCGGAGREAWD